jgi:hypothetical protein
MYVYLMKLWMYRLNPFGPVVNRKIVPRTTAARHLKSVVEKIRVGRDFGW